jgi:hypothetical protein
VYNPFLANVKAVSNPIPLELPVTTATGVISPFGFLLLLLLGVIRSYKTTRIYQCCKPSSINQSENLMSVSYVNLEIMQASKQRQLQYRLINPYS